MLVLAFDTATPAVTVALHDQSRVLAERVVVDARRHGELLAPSIAAVLADAARDRSKLTGIAVGVGPGPFTGLRVGLVTARALGEALRIPVYGVCTLDVLAYASGLSGDYAVATDARRKEVYWARYRDHDRVDGPHVDRPADAGLEIKSLPVVGEGALLYPDDLPDVREPRYPSAAVLAAWVAGGRPTVRPLPLYLRRPDAVEPTARKRVSRVSGSDRPHEERHPRDGAPPALRRMRWWDLPAVAELEQRLFPHEPWSVETFWSELAGVPDIRWYVVAESETGELVGYAGLLAVRDEGGIQTVAVREDRQGTGLGRRLLHALLEEASQRGCRTVFLEVRADNEPAQALYEKAGFEVIGRRRDYYGPHMDALVMRRRATVGGRG